MALLRHCLQQLRAKCGERDAFTGAVHPLPGQRVGDAPAAATRRLPTV